MWNAAVMAGLPDALPKSFEAAMAARQTQVLRTAYRILGNWADAEDVAQEAFVRLHRNGLQFASDAALGAWLYRVTVNLCLDHTRSARPSLELVDMPSSAANAEARAIEQQRQDRLMSALAKLPARERAAVVLREIEGMPTAEVAAILGSTEGTVRSQVAKAIVKLRTLLEESNHAGR